MLTLLAGASAYAQQAVPPIFDPTGRSGEPPAPFKKEFKVPTPVPLPNIPGFFIVTPNYMIAEMASEVILADTTHASG